MEYEKAYVFQPKDTRPVKRRRAETLGLQASWNLRRRAYQAAWGVRQERIDASLQDINASTVDEIGTYLDEALNNPQDFRIPAGIILIGPNTASSTAISKLLADRQASDSTRRTFVSISSGSGSNLKALLKTLIQRATFQIIEDDDEPDEVQQGLQKDPKLLSYDLQLLANHVKEQQTEQVVLSFQDTEAFNSSLLSELVELMGCWRDRIPFVCLFNIATSVDFLQQRLSKSAIKCLQGKLFDVAPAREALEQVFETMVDHDAAVWIGPDLAGMVLERQDDYIQSIDSFVDAVQYGYMSHFYANALSVFLDSKVPLRAVKNDHFEAIRNLDSFRAWARGTLDDGRLGRVRRMLESNEDLIKFVAEQLEAGRRKLYEIVRAVDLIRLLQQHIPNTIVSSKPKLYVQAMSGKLAGSATLRTLLLTIRKQPSDTARTIVEAVAQSAEAETVLTGCTEIVVELDSITHQNTNNAKPLQSEDDIKHATLRTTVVAQKVELSKQKSALSKEDSAYTALLRRFTDLLDAYFAATLVDPKDLVFNEIFVYDLRSPSREVFTPRPRHAIERALATPCDYLDCECCVPKRGQDLEAALAATQPATAVLYQLYLESSSLINASDLWTAFQAVMGADEEEKQSMALFQRALADLKHLGMVKTTRKRVDHIAKVAWRGL